MKRACVGALVLCLCLAACGAGVPSDGPSPSGLLLDPDYSGRGERSLPVFTATSYTVVISCMGGGSLTVQDTETTRRAPYMGLCDGSFNQISDTRLNRVNIRLHITVNPQTEWEARLTTH